jgi:hypothetical protein
MKRLAIVLSVLASLTFTGASAHPDAGVHHDRIEHVVSAQKYPKQGTPVIVEVHGHGEYAVTYTVNGQTSSSIVTGSHVGTLYAGNGALVVLSVAAMDGGASCRMYSRTGRLLAAINGGNAVSCTWRNR